MIAEMKHEPPGSAAHIENPSAHVSHRLPFDRPPSLERREVQLGTRADGEVSVVALDDLPSVPAVEMIEHRAAVRVLSPPQHHRSPLQRDVGNLPHAWAR